MEDLVRWLNTQLDEDERIARAATQGEWVWSREFVTPPGYHHRTVGPLEPGDAAFIAANGPARVLREIDAKRQLLAEYQLADAEAKYPDWAGGYASGLEYAVQLAAAEYADRPGYDQEWAPRSQWGPPSE